MKKTASKIYVWLVFAAALLTLTAVSCVSGMSEEEFAQKFDAEYSARQLSAEEQEAQFAEQFDDLFIDRYSSLEKSRQEDFAVWLDQALSDKLLSEDERRAEFEQFYGEVQPTAEERRAEAMQLLREAVLSGGHDKSGLTLELADPEAINEVSAFSRPLYGKVEFIATVDEAVAIFKRLRDMSDEDIEGKTAEEILPLSAEISPGGTVTIPVTEVMGQAILGVEHVLSVQSQVYLLVCSDLAKAVDREAFEHFFLKVFVQPKAGEADWKTEKVFDGSAIEMCSGGEGLPHFYEDTKTAVFKRPETKVLPVPETDTLAVADFSKLEPRGHVFYTTDFGLGFMTWQGTTLAIIKGDSLKPPAMIFVGIMGITPSFDDIGVPVYYVERDADNPLRLVGFIVEMRGAAYVLPASYILENVKEFSYEAVK